MPDFCVGVIGDVISRRDAEAFGLNVFVFGSVLAFGIVLTICSSKSERSKTQFTLLMNHALTSDHPSRPVWKTRWVV